jgi:ADP-L-glycero-D-manno-heptose 6-epimerase
MIVITGGAGFIGSAIIWALNKKGITDILVVDELLTDDKWKNLVNLKFTDYEEKGSFLKRVAFEDSLLRKTVDGVIHMGACSATTEKDASFLIENNYKYTQEIGSWCVRNGKKYVYASSAATYGDGSAGFDDDHKKLQTLKPLNKYGFSKYIMDNWALQTGAINKMAGVKFFNVFGPNEYHKEDMASVVFKAFGQINKTGKLQLFKSHRDGIEDGGQLRDFVYVKDAVDMTLFIYERGLAGIYNVGTGKARSFADLARATFNAMGKTVNIEFIDMPESIREKYQYFTEAKTGKIHSAGFGGEIHSLEDSVKDYVQNYLMKDDPYLG